MDQRILHVLRYFSFFSYTPNAAEVYTFLNTKVSKNDFNKKLFFLIENGKIYRKGGRLALHESDFQSFKEKKHHAEEYLKMVHKYIPYLKYIPTVRYVGLSGSLSMTQLSREGDIDLFIITKSNTIWITRFLVLIYKYIITAIQKKIGLKFCFNLFFSDNGLYIPPKKQNEYIGHELLQLKSIIDKEDYYQKLLAANDWIYSFFPNVPVLVKKTNPKENKIYKILYFIDLILKKAQIWWLKRNKLQWKEEHNQLWLIQNDFERIVKQNRLI